MSPLIRVCTECVYLRCTPKTRGFDVFCLLSHWNYNIRKSAGAQQDFNAPVLFAVTCRNYDFKYQKVATNAQV